VTLSTIELLLRSSLFCDVTHCSVVVMDVPVSLLVPSSRLTQSMKQQ